MPANTPPSPEQGVESDIKGKQQLFTVGGSGFIVSNQESNPEEINVSKAESTPALQNESMT